MFSIFLNFIFPPRCPNCSAYVERRGDFCAPCMRRLSTPHALVRTAEMMADLDGIWAFARYRAAVRDLLRALKYQKKRAALPALHTLLVAGKEVLHDLPRPLVAVPVPLAPERRKTRGFNQAEEIFASWLRTHEIPVAPLLVRTRETTPLYEHTREERRRELRGAFAVSEGADLTGADILLVDDIMTTGATLVECARTLKHAGAGRIYAFVLASEHM